MASRGHLHAAKGYLLITKRKVGRSRKEKKFGEKMSGARDAIRAPERVRIGNDKGKQADPVRT